MGILDRDYMHQKGTASKPNLSNVHASLHVSKLVQRLKQVVVIFWSIFAIGLLASAFLSPQEKTTLNCNKTLLLTDTKSNDRFTYTTLGKIAQQIVMLPIKFAQKRTEFNALISFFEISPTDCASLSAIVLSGVLLFMLSVSVAWGMSISLLLLRHATKYLLFDLLNASSFTLWRCLAFQLTYPKFVWLIPLPHVALICVGLTVTLLLKSAEPTITKKGESKAKRAQSTTDNDAQSPSKRFPHSKIDSSDDSPAVTYEQRLIRALNEVRRRGCGKQAGISEPMRHTEGMDLLARLVLAGVRNYEDRLSEAKYLAFGGSGVNVALQSSPEATGRDAANALCKDLLNPHYTVAGVAITKNRAHIHVAREFDPPKAGDEIEMRNRFLKKINQARQTGYKCGDNYYPPAGPLKLNELLSEASRRHAEDVFKHPGIGHKGWDGSSPTERAQRVGYRFPVGENLTNLSDQPEDAVRSLLGSPKHCENLMNPNYTEMGVGYFVDASKMPGIVWVQKLARDAPN
jgi:uncharacterized protein YkwD